LGVTSAARRAWWIAPAVLAAGLAAAVAVILHPLPDRTPFEYGLLYPARRYEQALPLVGLGFAIAWTRTRLSVLLSYALLTLGIGVGAVLASVIAAAISAGANLIGYLYLLAPACAVATGIALVAPRPLRAFLVAVASLMSGALLGLLINISDPSTEEQTFAAGAVLCGAWLVTVAFLFWRQLEQPWFPIAGRILGGWLIAVGALLAALHLIPPR
jgi:hypothetical protein